MIYHNIYENTDLTKIKNVSIILCIKCDDNEYRILVGERKDNKWTAPGGRVELKELNTDKGLFDAICREFEEETGYDLNGIPMCYPEYFIFDRIHRNKTITRIYMNCTMINNFFYDFNTKTNTYKIKFGNSYKKDNELTDLACYTLKTIFSNESKYIEYFINGLKAIKEYAQDYILMMPKKIQ